MTGVGRGAWGVGVWVLLVAGVIALAGAFGARFEAAELSEPPRSQPSSTAQDHLPPPESLATVAVSRDLFRFGRRPSPVAYDPMREMQSVQVAQAPPKPMLLVVGIVAGAEPSAVIEGFPGVEGARVVRSGDEISGLKVARIGRKDVRIVGMDTVWVLEVREPWR